MKASAWKSKIKKQCTAAGTYREEFRPAVETLSTILERRDAVFDEFVATGAQPLVTRTSDRGSENQVVNPLVTLWKDLNTQALAYWRDLGLTPAGLKRINEAAMKKPKQSALEEALRDVGS